MHLKTSLQLNFQYYISNNFSLSTFQIQLYASLQLKMRNIIILKFQLPLIKYNNAFGLWPTSLSHSRRKLILEFCLVFLDLLDVQPNIFPSSHVKAQIFQGLQIVEHLNFFFFFPYATFLCSM